MINCGTYIVLRIPNRDGTIHVHEVELPCIATVDEWVEWWDKVIAPLYPLSPKTHRR